MAEFTKIYKSADGTEITIKMKTECSTEQEMMDALSFMAQSSHQFYIEAGNEIRHKL